MNKFITRILDKMSLNGMNISLYQLEDVLATALISHSMENGLETIYRYKEGFLSIKIADFISAIDNKFKLLSSGTDANSIYTTDESILSISNIDDEDNKLEIYMLTQNREAVKNFDEVCKAHIGDTKANTIFALSASSEGYFLSSLGKLESPLIRENYSNTVLENFDFVVDDFQAVDPHGRLLIVNGPPGTGKTYLVKGIISELKESTVIVIPPKMISEIDGPSLLPVFISHKKRNSSSIVLIIEDADACLAPRSSDNISAISSLLNCADGILGSLLDIRVVATTNQEKMEFDAALTRPGRLSRHIEVELLEADKATEVYKRLTKNDTFQYTDKKALADIYIEADLATGGKIKGAKKKGKSQSQPFNRNIRNRLGF